MVRASVERRVRELRGGEAPLLGELLVPGAPLGLRQRARVGEHLLAIRRELHRGPGEHEGALVIHGLDLGLVGDALLVGGLVARLHPRLGVVDLLPALIDGGPHWLPQVPAQQDRGAGGS